MIYRTFQDIQLSSLGMGAMRLPVINGDDSQIDEAAAFRMWIRLWLQASTITIPPGAITTASRKS